jgi:GT2 family glycosyltransferase
MFQNIKEDDHLCTVPLLKTEKSDIVPYVFLPAFIKRKLNILSITKARHGTTTILPFDYCGIYNREKFILHQGFDINITSSYWQKLDFGFRAFMWGEKITCYPSLIVKYTSHTSYEDNTVDNSYKAFYLKNIAVKYKAKKGYLPYSKYFSYMLRSDTGPIASLKEFFTTKKWVKENASRFKREAKRVVTEWRIPE